MDGWIVFWLFLVYFLRERVFSSPNGGDDRRCDVCLLWAVYGGVCSVYVVDDWV